MKIFTEDAPRHERRASLESRMMGNYHVRFGGGPMEKDHWWKKEPWKSAPWWKRLLLLGRAILDALEHFPPRGTAGP